MMKFYEKKQVILGGGLCLLSLCFFLLSFGWYLSIDLQAIFLYFAVAFFLISQIIRGDFHIVFGEFELLKVLCRLQMIH